MCLASIVMSDVATPSIVHFAKAIAEASTSRPAADRLLGGDPQQTIRNYFSDATGQFFAGVWESSPGRWRVQYSENEFCHLTKGRVRINAPSGQSWTFGAGDSFVIPAGFAGIWEVLEPASKLYVVFEPAHK